MQTKLFGFDKKEWQWKKKEILMKLVDFVCTLFHLLAERFSP